MVHSFLLWNSPSLQKNGNFNIAQPVCTIISLTDEPKMQSKTCKNLLKKAKASGEPLLALLDWRNMPTENVGTSPAQKLMGRQTRTLLPTHQNLLKADGDQGTNKKLENCKAKQAKLYNNKSQPLRHYNEEVP